MDKETSAIGLDVGQIIDAGGILTGAIILVITWALVRAVTATFTRLGQRFVDKRLVLQQMATLLRFGLYIVGLAIAIGASVRLSNEVMLALTGTLAVTVGFALKDLAASVLAGVIILIDRPFQVGDRVTFGTVYGEIASIGLRSVRLVTLDDSVVTIPNNKFLTDVVSSGNAGALDMLIQMDFHVGLDQDVPLAKRLLGEALTSSRFVFTSKPWSVLVSLTAQPTFAVRLRAKAYVLDVKHEKLFESDVTERVLVAFQEHGILPPAELRRVMTEPVPKPRRESRPSAAGSA